MFSSHTTTTLKIIGSAPHDLAVYSNVSAATDPSTAGYPVTSLTSDKATYTVEFRDLVPGQRYNVSVYLVSGMEESEPAFGMFYTSKLLLS